MSSAARTATTKCRAIGLALVASLALAVLPANASDPEADLQLGRERYDRKEYAGAIEAWERVVATAGEDRAWRVLYNLGLAYQESGDASRAVERFDAFLARLAREPGSLAPELEERRQDAAERVRAIRATNGEVRVQPAGGEVALVRVGTLAPRPAGFSVIVAPGPVEIEIAPSTPRARSITVIAEAGKAITIEATPLPPPVVAPPPLAPPPRPIERRGFPTAFVLAGAGLTLASFALPLALGGTASKRRDDAAALGAGDTRYAAARQDFESARTAYYASFALPAALGAVTLAVASVGFARRGTVVAAGGLGPGGAWVGGRF